MYNRSFSMDSSFFTVENVNILFFRIDVAKLLIYFISTKLFIKNRLKKPRNSHRQAPCGPHGAPHPGC